ncbi:MAG: hypothetical protein KBC48_01580 [Candidatus Pacebacteria bacterium]|nr:hypothetical protein [Candidatus Paceibacterota bacterium]
MDNYHPDKLRELYGKLPKNIQEVISSEDTDEKIFDISQKYDLHIDTTGGLGKLTLMVMIGLLKPQEFIPELIKRLKLDQETANKVAKEVNEQIFKPVHDSLKRIHGLDGSKPLMEDVKAELVAQNNAPTPTFDNRIGKYFSTNQTSDPNTLAPRPYTQDPYREHPN